MREREGTEMGVTKTHGNARKPDGFLESEDNSDVVKLPSTVVIRAFQRGLWHEINAECGTNIDAYEGVWLESSNLVKAAKLIRQSLIGDRNAPVDYRESLIGAAGMLETCAGRHVRVMVSL